jgi:hypothetical protein
MTKGRLSLIWQHGTSAGVPKRSLLVALIVGSVLNLINQGDALFGGGRLNLFKLILTFAVPYAVATYGAVAARISANQTSPRLRRSMRRVKPHP